MAANEENRDLRPYLRKQLAEAAALEAQIEAMQNGTAPKPQDQPQPAPATAAQPVTPTSETAPATPPAPAAPVESPAPVASQPQPDPGQAGPTLAEFQHLQQMFSTLKGKYDAEVPRYAAENRELRRQLNANPARASAPAPELGFVPPPAPPSVNDPGFMPAPDKVTEADLQKFLSITREQIESYGVDYWRPVYAGIYNSTAPIRAGQAQMQAMQQQMADQAFKAELARLVPAWSVIDDLPEFAAFLDANTEEFSGRSFRDLAGSAWRAGDAGRVARFYTAFAAANPSAVPATLPGAAAVAKPSIASQAMPSARPPVQPATARNKPVYSFQEWSSLNAGLIRGQLPAAWSGRKLAFDDELQTAFVEGRVTGIPAHLQVKGAT
jgi:hypothetical protein